MMASKLSLLTAILAAAIGVLLAGCTERSRTDRRLSQADKFFAAGDFAKAEQEYLQALLAKPGDAETIGRLGVLYYKQGRVIQAYTFLDQALKSLPANVDYQLQFGLTNFTLGRTQDARVAARKVLEARPREEAALMLLVNTSVTSRDNEEARRIVEELQRKNGDSVGYHLALGALMRRQRNLAGAEELLQKALALEPKSPTVHDQLSQLFTAKKETERAAEHLKTASELAPARSPIRVKYIDHLIRNNARDEAKKILAATLAEAPDCTPALIVDMNLAFVERRLEDATSAAKKILNMDRSNYPALMQLAAIKAEGDDIPGVIAQLLELERHYARVPDVKFNLAKAHLRAGDLYAAEESLNKAIAISPNFEDGLLLLAEVQLRKSDPNKAIPLLQKVLKRKPQLRRAQVLLAQAHRSRGDHAESLKILRALAEAAPRNPDNHHLIGLALAQSDPVNARKAFERAVEISETHWAAQDVLVEFDLDAKKHADAAQRVEKLIAKHPQAAMPWLLRAQVRLAEGQLREAEADFNKAVEIDPEAHRAYLGLARIYFETNQGPQAVDKLSASAAKTRNAGVYMQLGMLQEAVGQPEAARASYEKALTINKNFAPALNNLAALFANKFGDIEKALALARRAYDRNSGDPLICDTLAWVHFKQGAYASALPLLQSSIEKLPKSTQVNHHLALTYYYLGQETNARETFERVISLAGQSKLAAEARDHLAVLSIDSLEPGVEHREKLTERLSREPNDPAALIRLGLIEARHGSPQKAVDWLEQALKTNPRAVPAMVALAELNLGPLQNDKKGREWATKAHTAAPTDAQVSRRLGRLMYLAGDFAWASTMLQYAVRAFPDESDLRFDFARALFDAGRIKEAEPNLKLVLESTASPTTLEAARQMHVMLSALTSSDANREAAQAQARQILAKNPDSLPALMVVAAGLEQGGKFREAREAYDKVLARNSAFAPAIRQLALLYADHLAEDAKAEEFALKARQTYSDDPDLALVLGSVSYRRADYQSAVRFFQQALRKRDNHALTLFLLGMSHYYLKNAAESRIHLERAIETRKLPPQESTEAERVVEELSRGRA